MPTFSKIRAGFVLIAVGCVMTGMIGRVAYLQTYARQRIIRSADRQQHTTLTLLARRGSIFDRNGHELVGTAQSLVVYIDPHFTLEQIEASKDATLAKDKRYTPAQLDADLRRLADIVDCKPAELIALVKEQAGKRYVKIAEEQSQRVGEEVMKLGIPGVGVEPQCVRYYPMAPLASQVLGSVGADGVGHEGIEMNFQAELAGKDGYKRFEKDARRRPLSVDEGDYVPPVHGQHLVLTIDACIQMIAENELRSVCQEKQAERGEAIVMDPYTGEILALANYQKFHPERADAEMEMRRNSSLVMPYEPGSIFKPFIVGPALETHVTRINEVWPTGPNPFIDPHGRRVSDVHPSGAHLCTWDIIVKSSNQGMTMLSERMGNPAIYRAITSFGFGRRTGIELPGEEAGLVKAMPWTYADTPSVAQGYAVMVTPLQLARAYCVYANGGRLVNPHIVRGWLDADGKLIEQPHGRRFEDLPRVLSEETVQTMRRMMADVPIRGTGTAASKECPYWNIFGKTGTAHISLGRQGYSSNRYNSSFLCAAPVECPKVVVAMTVHEPDPREGYFGGLVTAPAAGKLMKHVLAYMDEPMSPPAQLPPPEVIPVLHNFQPSAYPRHGATDVQ